MRVSLNTEQSAFVIPSGPGYTCLGFEVCQQWTRDIAKELDRPDLEPTAFGTLDAYREYESALQAARARVAATGRSLCCQLTPQLIGLEGQRVEVIDRHLEARSFVVGRSGGFMPVHLELASERSRHGVAVMGAPFYFVRVPRRAAHLRSGRAVQRSTVPAWSRP